MLLTGLRKGDEKCYECREPDMSQEQEDAGS